jgi:L-lactate utilization protein LutB
MDTQMEATLSALQKRHTTGLFAEDTEEAKEKILSLIPKDAGVGMGDSTAIRQIGVLPALRERGTRVLNPFEPKEPEVDVEDHRRRRERIVKEATLCDVFLTGTNAVTEDGKMVNVDATGNRVAGMFWGHPLSIIVVGRNKIVRDLDEAFTRIRMIIAPSHFRIRTEKGGRKRQTPCEVTGQCNDCRAEGRGCNIFTIIVGRPSLTP